MHQLIGWVRSAFLCVLLLSYLHINAQICGTPGLDGAINISQSVNTYFPVANQEANSGANSIVLLAVPPQDRYGNNFGTIPIKKGDMLLIIQMQDAEINFTNSAQYGANLINSGPDNLGGSGFTAINNTGVFEYAIATNDISLNGGLLRFRAGGVGKGLVNTYVNAAATNTRGKRTFQVVRVPQYSNLILNSDISTPPFNGVAGGIIAFDVSGSMDFNSYKINASARGFRGGYGKVGYSGDNTRDLYVVGSSQTTSVGKGEGIAGTPRYMWDGYNEVDNLIEGLPGGSYGKGAPANAGGGGNDHNAGGGGGGNGGAGGVGGDGTRSVNGIFPNGGRPGSKSYNGAAPELRRLVMGGGGGGGDANNARSDVKGGVGGGIVLINVGRISGSGNILAKGGDGEAGALGSAPDGAGGGGAGGTVFIKVSNPDPSANLTIDASGGKGGHTQGDFGENDQHGPGGGGGGGIVYYNIPASTVNVNVVKGNSGLTRGGNAVNSTQHGALDGENGIVSSFAIPDLPPYLQGGGAICFPELTTTLERVNTYNIFKGDEVAFKIKVSNKPGGGNAGGIQVQVQLPNGFIYKSASLIYSGADSEVTGAIQNLNTSNLSEPLFGDFNIDPEDYLEIILIAEANCNLPNGIYHSNAQSLYLDPTRTAADPDRRISPVNFSFAGVKTVYEGTAANVAGSNYNGTSSNVEDVTVIAVPVLSNNILSMDDANPVLCDSGNPSIINGTDPSGGNGVYAYLWQSSLNGIDFTDIENAIEQHYNPDEINVTTFYRRIVSSSICISSNISDPIKIVVAPSPLVDFESPGFCLEDGAAQFTDLSSIADGSENEFSYEWLFKGVDSENISFSFLSIIKNPQVPFELVGNYTAQLKVTSNNGCETILSKPFTVNGSSPIAAFEVLQNCSNKDLIFEDKATVAPGQLTKIEWFIDEVNHPGDPAYHIVDLHPNLREDSSKQYSFTYPPFTSPLSKEITVRMVVYSGESCFNELPKNITIYASPVLEFDTIPNMCSADAPVLLEQARETGGVPGVGVYSGNGVDHGYFNPEIAGVGEHTVTYTYTTENGCITEKSIQVRVRLSPVAEAGKLLEILAGGSIELPASVTGEDLTYSWYPTTGLSNPNILNPIASPVESTIYTLTATSANGCSTFVRMEVRVLEQPFVPNTFTPNGDGVNDFWNIEHLDTYNGATVEVFNRYGNKVFSVKGYGQPWDGTHNGVPLPVGTYYYIINPQRGLKVISGSITIIR
jgi:gliding motility-associated-like protein